MVATTIGCCNNEVKVYDSLFSFLDKDSLDIVKNMFTCEGVKPVIKMARCQKQKGSKDCGVYAIVLYSTCNPYNTRSHNQSNWLHTKLNYKSSLSLISLKPLRIISGFDVK